MCNADPDAMIRAFLSSSPYAHAEKSLWLDKYLPEITPERRILIPFGRDKSEMVKGGLQSGDYLLDDYTNNLTSWNPAQGIKLLKGINHTRGTWQGNKIRCDKPPYVLARDIARIMELGETIWDDKPKAQNRTQRSYMR